MKIKTMAALSLFACAILVLPLSSFAGKPDPTDCEFQALDTACSAELAAAYMTLGENMDAFVSKNADSDFYGLRCKVVGSEVKMSQDKPYDAYKKLDDSYNKIWTLLAQRKIDSESSAMEMADDIYEALSCVEAEISN
jgi:hypothetical protein